jgi:hypothetical protein
VTATEALKESAPTSETLRNMEEAWERAGYLRAAAKAAAADAENARLVADAAADGDDPYVAAYEDAANAAFAAFAEAAALTNAPAPDYVIAAAYARGRERWRAEHPEARA